MVRFLIGPSLLMAGATLSGAAQTRDAQQWPFAQNSIWNQPIGSKAVYVPAGFGAPPWVGLDVERFYVGQAADPSRPVYAPAGGGSGPACSGTSTQQGPYAVQVPDNLLLPDDTGNRCVALLRPDGRTLATFNYFTRCAVGGPVYGWHGPDTDLYGAGMDAGHGGSGLSALGGSIRSGELTGPGPICHALKLNVPAARYLYYPATPPPAGTPAGYRWPADRCDSYAPGTYKGTNPKLVMGSLLAIPPTVTAASLGLATEAGGKLFAALQTYGAYITDDTAGDSFDFPMQEVVQQEFYNKYNYNVWSSTGTTNTPYFQDCQKLIQSLQIVDNNSPASVGGGGFVSTLMAPVFATTVADTQAPAAPARLATAGQTSTSVTLRWYPAQDNIGIASYDIYAGTTKLASIVGTTTAYTASGLLAGATYKFTVRARDQAGNVSVASPSNTVTLSGSSGLVSGGVYRLVARHSGKALDVENNSSADKATVWQYGINNGGAQRWVVALQSDGAYTLTHEGTGKVLDVNANSSADGATVWQYSANGGDAQRWLITATDNGYYKLQHKGTTKALSVNGGVGATGDKALANQWEYVGDANQQWRLDLLSSPTSVARVALATSPALAAEALSVFPNPATGQLTVQLPVAQPLRSLRLLDNLGREVRQLSVPADVQQAQLDVRGLPAGVYLLQVQQAGQPTQTQKLLIQP